MANWTEIPDGLNWQGIWSVYTTYDRDDAVLYQTTDGSYHVFVSKTDHNTGNVPTSSYPNWTRWIQGVWTR